MRLAYRINNMNRFFTLLLLLVSFCGITYSQDYVVLSDGDTLVGQIEPISFSIHDGIVLKQGETSTKFKIDEASLLSIQGFSKDGHWYESGISKNTFVEAFAIGAANFYEDDKNFFLQKDGRVFLLPHGVKQVYQNETLKEVKVDSWKTILKNVLSDCDGPEYKKIDNQKIPTKEFLSALAYEYNICQGEHIQGEPIKNETLKRLSFSAGVGATTVDYPSDYSSEINAYYDFGIHNSILISNLYYPFYFDISFEYRKSKLESHRTQSGGTGSPVITRDKFQLKRNSLFIPIGIIVPLRSEKRGLMVFAHGLLEVRISGKYSFQRVVKNTDTGQVFDGFGYNRSFVSSNQTMTGFRAGLMYVKPTGKSSIGASAYFGQIGPIIQSESTKFVGLRIHYFLR